MNILSQWGFRSKRRVHEHLLADSEQSSNLIDNSLKTQNSTRGGQMFHPGWVWKFIQPFYFSGASVIPFVCPHTLGFNIHLHWNYLCGTGEHQLCPLPICCWDGPKRLDPKKTGEKQQQQAKKQRLQLVCVWLSVWRLCAGLLYVYMCVCMCVCLFLSFTLLWVWTQLPGASYSTLFTLHL